MSCNYNKFDRTSDWEKDFKKKLTALKSLLVEKHLLNGVSPVERKEFNSRLESTLEDLLAVFEEELVDPWRERYTSLQYTDNYFSMCTGIKEKADIPHQCYLDEQTKSMKFRILMELMQREDILIDYLDKIYNCIQNRRFPSNKLGDLANLVNILNPDEIESNYSLFQYMVEMAFKETEQSVFRSFQLSLLITILNKTSMMESYSSRLKSLISDIISAMEADDENEYHMWAFFYLVYSVKRTSFLDFFSPRFEQLFSKILRLEHEKDPYFWDSEYFIFPAIDGTKLLAIFEEWDRKNPI